MGTLFESLKSFLAEPFTTPMNFQRYAALVGLTMLIVVMWLFISREISAGYDKI